MAELEGKLKKLKYLKSQKLEYQDIDQLVNDLLKGTFNRGVNRNNGDRDTVPGRDTVPIINNIVHPKPTLSTISILHVDYPPDEHLVYSKGIQTIDLPSDPIPVKPIDLNPVLHISVATSCDLSPSPEPISSKTPIHSPIQLNDNMDIINSQDFIQFIETTSKFIDRALNDYDITIDYTAHNDSYN
jgi:hypothetical protein